MAEKTKEQEMAEMLAAAGLLGDNPVLEAIQRMHQNRIMQQQYPALGESLKPDKRYQEAKKD
jgi:hypothetical protein